MSGAGGSAGKANACSNQLFQWNQVCSLRFRDFLIQSCSQCMAQNNNSMTSCKFYFDMLAQCQKGESMLSVSFDLCFPSGTADATSSLRLSCHLWH